MATKARKKFARPLSAKRTPGREPAAAAGPANILVVDMIPASLSGENEQDSEPSVAVNPANPDQVVATAFTPDPLGGDTAPIFVSSDGGRTWSLNSIVPSQVITGDITVAFGGRNNNLYASILRFPAPPDETRLNILRTQNFQGQTPMKVLVDRLGVDQPYVQAISVGNGRAQIKDRVYVGANDFKSANGQTATVDISLDAAAAGPRFRSARIERRHTVGQNGPQARPACHSDGTVYVAFYGWRSQTGDWQANTLVVTADVVVVRDDNGATGANAFQALIDTDATPGKRVALGVSFPFHITGRGVPGQQRLGGDVAVAVDPRTSSTIWIAWCDLQGPSGYTLHVRRSTDRGVTWSAQDLRTIPGAINPGLATNSDGTVGLLYQQLTGSGASLRWVVHFRRTLDDSGANWDDVVLATAPANTPSVVPPEGFDPYLGDYAHLMAVGRNFYGVFSANNTPDTANFPSGVVFQRNHDFNTRQLLDLNGSPVHISIDPFFFKVTM